MPALGRYRRQDGDEAFLGFLLAACYQSDIGASLCKFREVGRSIVIKVVRAQGELAAWAHAMNLVEDQKKIGSMVYHSALYLTGSPSIII